MQRAYAYVLAHSCKLLSCNHVTCARMLMDGRRKIYRYENCFYVEVGNMKNFDVEICVYFVEFLF